MKILYRMGSSEDLPVILKFLEKREHFPAYIGYEEPCRVRQVISDGFTRNREILDDRSEFPSVFARDQEGNELGYMIYMPGVEESITGDRQVVLFDYHVEPGRHWNRLMDHFLEQGRRWALQSGIPYVTVEIMMDRPEQEACFGSRGFKPDMNRIVKRVGRYSFDEPRHARYAVRNACDGDRAFILLVSSQNSSFLAPAGREDMDRLKESFFDIYSGLNLDNDPLLKVYVIEDREKMRPAGYMMIRFRVFDLVSNKPLAYIYDLSLSRDYWGKNVVQRIVREVENRLSEMDIELLVGDVSEDNPRPLVTAVRTLGFKIYSRRWVMRV